MENKHITLLTNDGKSIVLPGDFLYDAVYENGPVRLSLNNAQLKDVISAIEKQEIKGTSIFAASHIIRGLLEIKATKYYFIVRNMLLRVRRKPMKKYELDMYNEYASIFGLDKIYNFVSKNRDLDIARSCGVSFIMKMFSKYNIEKWPYKTPPTLKEYLDIEELKWSYLSSLEKPYNPIPESLQNIKKSSDTLILRIWYSSDNLGYISPSRELVIDLSNVIGEMPEPRDLIYVFSPKYEDNYIKGKVMIVPNGDINIDVSSSI